MTDRLARLARRVENDPFFLASALNDYALSEGLDRPALAMTLACPVETLDQLALCRRPSALPPRFRRDIDRIAARFAVNADALAQIVRRADALATIRRGAEDDSGTLMAARDRDEPATNDSASDDPRDQPC